MENVGSILLHRHRNRNPSAPVDQKSTVSHIHAECTAGRIAPRNSYLEQAIYDLSSDIIRLGCEEVRGNELIRATRDIVFGMKVIICHPTQPCLTYQHNDCVYALPCNSTHVDTTSTAQDRIDKWPDEGHVDLAQRRPRMASIQTQWHKTSPQRFLLTNIPLYFVVKPK